MKRILLLSGFLLMTVLVAKAQRTVSGQVIDSELNETVIQATVSLLKTDSSQVANALTNTEGQFQLTAPADGKYLLRITYVGYKTLFKNI